MAFAIFKDSAFFKSILRIAIPVALQNLLSTTASMVDTAMLGSQGQLAVAAVGICSQFAGLMFGMYFGFLSGGTIFFSQFWGARDEKGVARSYGLMLVCMMFVGLLFGSVASLQPRLILDMYTDKASIAVIGAEYLRIVGLSFPLQVLAMAMSALLRSTERVRVPLYASILSLATNVFLNWALIFGHFGLPAMGVRGAAVATLASAVVNVLVLYIACFLEKNMLLLRIRDHFGWTADFVKRYFTKCLPVILNEVLYGLGMMTVNIVIGRQDEAGIAAMAVFRVIEGLVFAFYGGLSNAASVIVGKHIGAGDHELGFRDAKRFAILCPLVVLTICLLLQPFRHSLLTAFGLTGQALDYGMWMLVIYIAAGTFRTTNFITNNMYRAGGETVFGSVTEVGFLLCLSVPTVTLAGLVFELPFLAVYGLIYVDEYIRFALCAWYLRSGRWIKPVTQEGLATIDAFREKHGIRVRKGVRAG